MSKREFIKGSWVPLTKDMLSSPSWRALSQPARQILDRLVLEWMRHRGETNGDLRVSYLQFEDYGVRYGSIASALRELEELGIIKMKIAAERVNAGLIRAPSMYELTWLPTQDHKETNDWRSITADEQAAEAKAKAKRPRPHLRRVA